MEPRRCPSQSTYKVKSLFWKLFRSVDNAQWAQRHVALAAADTVRLVQEVIPIAQGGFGILGSIAPMMA